MFSFFTKLRDRHLKKQGWKIGKIVELDGTEIKMYYTENRDKSIFYCFEILGTSWLGNPDNTCNTNKHIKWIGE